MKIIVDNNALVIFTSSRLLKVAAEKGASKFLVFTPKRIVVSCLRLGQVVRQKSIMLWPDCKKDLWHIVALNFFLHSLMSYSNTA